MAPRLTRLPGIATGGRSEMQKCAECSKPASWGPHDDALHDLGWTDGPKGWRCRDCTHREPNGLHAMFVYGILKTPDVALDPPDEAEGRLYCGSFAQARFDEPGIIRGQVREIDIETLAHWDRIEGIESGMYSRIRIETTTGVECWAYQYELRREPSSFILEDGLWVR